MQKYSGWSIFFHWFIAILIVAAFALGFYMTDLKISPTKLKFYAWHKWLGVSVLLLVLPRLAVKLRKGTPEYPSTLQNWEKQIAKITHLLLYGFMFAVPISGYLYTYAAGFPVVYLGLVQLPAVIAPDPAWKDSLKELHESLTTGLLVLVGLHLAAVVKHQFIDKDGVLKRMMPSRSTTDN